MEAENIPRTLEAIFSDFVGRRAGIIKALTTDVEEFYRQCDPESVNLCLYGFPSGQWEVSLPGIEVPGSIPRPAVGINFARDRMQEKDWLSLVAARSDVWLLVVAFHFGAISKFDMADRSRLYNLISDLPTLLEVVGTGPDKKQQQEKSSGPSNKPMSNSNSEMPYEGRDLVGVGELAMAVESVTLRLGE